MAETKKFVLEIDVADSVGSLDGLTKTLKKTASEASKTDDALNDAAEKVGDLSTAANKSSNNMNKLETGLKNSETAAVNFSGSWNDVTNGLKSGNIAGAAAAFKGLTKAVWNNTAALLKNPFGLIAVAVSALIAVLISLGKSFADTTEGAAKVKGIMIKLEPAINIVKEVLNDVGRAALWVADKFATLVEKLIPARGEMDKTRQSSEKLAKSLIKINLATNDYEKSVKDMDLALTDAGDETLSLAERQKGITDAMKGLEDQTKSYLNTIEGTKDAALTSLAGTFYEAGSADLKKFTDLHWAYTKLRESGAESFTDSDIENLRKAGYSIDQVAGAYEKLTDEMLTSTNLTEKGNEYRQQVIDLTKQETDVIYELKAKRNEVAKQQREWDNATIESTDNQVKQVKKEVVALKELKTTIEGIPPLDIPIEIQSMDGLIEHMALQNALVAESNDRIRRMNKTSYDQQKEDVIAYYNKIIEDQKGNIAVQEQLEEEKNEVLKKLDKERKEETAMASLNAASQLASGMADIFDSQIKQGEDLTEAEHKQNEKMFNASKGMKIAQVTIDTIMGSFQAITSAISQFEIVPGAIIGGIMAAGITAGGIASVANISKTKYNRSGRSGGGSASKVNIPAPVIPKQEAVKGISQKGDEKMDLDTKVYVLESDISGTQSKVKVAESESTF